MEQKQEKAVIAKNSRDTWLVSIRVWEQTEREGEKTSTQSFIVHFHQKLESKRKKKTGEEEKRRARKKKDGSGSKRRNKEKKKKTVDIDCTHFLHYLHLSVLYF